MDVSQRADFLYGFQTLPHYPTLCNSLKIALNVSQSGQFFSTFAARSSVACSGKRGKEAEKLGDYRLPTEISAYCSLNRNTLLENGLQAELRAMEGGTGGMLPRPGTGGTSAATAGAETASPAPVCCGHGCTASPSLAPAAKHSWAEPCRAAWPGHLVSISALRLIQKRQTKPTHHEEPPVLLQVTSPLLLSPRGERGWTTANRGCFCWWLIMRLSLLF